MGNEQQRAPGPNYWIFLPGLGVAVGAFLLSFGSERQPLLLLWVSAALVPTLGGVTLKSIGQHSAASVCAVVVLACYWTPVFLLLFTLIAKPALGFVMAVYGGFIAIPITALALAATASFSKTMGRRWAGAAVIAGTLPAIAVAVSAILHVAKYTN